MKRKEDRKEGREEGREGGRRGKEHVNHNSTFTHRC